MPGNKSHLALWTTPRRELDEVARKDGPRLVSKKAAQTFHNAGRLQGIIAQGAEHTTVRAGLWNPQPNGVVRRGSSIPQTIRRQISPEADNCGGLEQEMKMAVGARVMLRRNIGTEDGLVNGVMGIVVGFEWPEGVAVDDPERQPTAIKVLFDNKSFFCPTFCEGKGRHCGG
jgi:hypothetical protein